MHVSRGAGRAEASGGSCAPGRGWEGPGGAARVVLQPLLQAHGSVWEGPVCTQVSASTWEFREHVATLRARVKHRGQAGPGDGRAGEVTPAKVQREEWWQGCQRRGGGSMDQPPALPSAPTQAPAALTRPAGLCLQLLPFPARSWRCHHRRPERRSLGCFFKNTPSTDGVRK